MSDKCPTCKVFVYSWRVHICPPSWECIIKDYHDEEEPVSFYSDGYDEERVAEAFAARCFNGEGSEWEIWVRKNPDTEWKKYTVTVEAVPSFTAYRVEV